MTCSSWPATRCLPSLVNAINRIPIDEGASEATYEVRVLADNERAPEVRKGVLAELKRAAYPVADVDLVTGP